ncbi:hypothetical protein [Chitinophaga vietnamensis]|uniref:hypothetical protein n=1 Tax=Chitinophaga vietnamensis TaxID=2593957 RepID=UPI0011775B3D|nr:hypothetical protein [Chitinophaga vietnamensis]
MTIRSKMIMILLLVAVQFAVASKRGTATVVSSSFASPDTSGGCYSAITESNVNPYVYSIAGNWRVSRTYTYYSTRAEGDTISNLNNSTNIRQYGAFPTFVPFWTRQGNSWQGSTDTTKWVWNAESTLFNTKGFELENRDPLGRYNAGLYGYDNALPIAVIQNSRYRESLFEGFEDYDFGNNNCDTSCSNTRGFDFSPFRSNFDTTAHTGRYSLRVSGGSSVAVSTFLTPTDDPSFSFTINKQLSTCTTDSLLKTIQSDARTLLPSFSPINGSRLLVSAWVKEDQDCKCISYTKNSLTVTAGNNTVAATLKGSIIDGWQRYEAIVDVPASGSVFTITMQANGTNVFFDDIRVHPFNGNMKSFVYDPVSLRLMAELDENNYATFYEYDDEGTLIRVKKETERGIKTIRETRSALLKE